MKEIGGYIELDNFTLPMLHDNAIKLNCGRSALAYLIEARNIHTIWLPYFLCDSVSNVCKKYGVQIKYYRIDKNWLPQDVCLLQDEWLYAVNFYGQLTKGQLQELVSTYKNVIIDNAQAYFDESLPGVDILYTCRKFFGVSDGAILYTDAVIDRELQRDESFERIHYILGRYERNASEFYTEASNNNDIFDYEDIKQMSRLTENLLHGIDYNRVKQIRTENFAYLHSKLGSLNQLNVRLVYGAFMYPLMVDDADKIKAEFLKNKVYIPTLWPNVLTDVSNDCWERDLAKNVLPLPVDQRYGLEEMEKICIIIKGML